MRFLLASNSPRRRQLLSLAGWDFSVQAPDVDESQLPGEPPVEYVLRISKTKVMAVSPHELVEAVIAADTIVVDAGQILGKPSGAAEARAVLQRLRAGTHQVYTGLAVYFPSADRLYQDWSVTDVPMRGYTDEEIDAYIATGDPLDKAGAYAIQHPGFRPVERLEGCYANVVGLPLCHLTRTLARAGIQPGVDLPAACQAHLGYRCPVYRDILQGG